MFANIVTILLKYLFKVSITHLFAFTSTYIFAYSDLIMDPIRFNELVGADNYVYDDNSTIDNSSVAADSVLSPGSVGEESISYELEDDNLSSEIFSLDKEGLAIAKAYAENIENKDMAFDDDNLDNLSISSIYSTEESFITEISDADSVLLAPDCRAEDMLTACVLMDIVNGEIRTCGNIGKYQRPLAQLLGTWEIDKAVFQKSRMEGRMFISFCPRC